MLKVKKNNIDSKYIYFITHYRSYIDFSIYEIVFKEDPRDPFALASANDASFSNEDISKFNIFFCSYALECMKGFAYIPEPFIKHSDSNFLIFGFLDNKYFIRQYEDQADYIEEKELLKDKIHSKEDH
jgi:hypothetical protein